MSSSNNATTKDESLRIARAVADTVLYEGYLLYPYRASSSKNQVRWQFGVLAPEGSAAAIGEESDMAAQCLLSPAPDDAVTVRVRCLQLQTRSVERAAADGSTTPVAELEVDGTSWLSWDEAVPCEQVYGPFRLPDLLDGVTIAVEIAAGEQVEVVRDTANALVGRVVRRRQALVGTLRLDAVQDEGHLRLATSLANISDPVDGGKDEVIQRSFLGAHLLLTAQEGRFVSVIDPPADAADAAARCQQRRCWPVLAGVADRGDAVLGLPIILYDYPEVAEQSAGALFDATEIDEILTLRVMTMTEEEKAQARATDPHAAAIIDRCEQMTPQEMQRLHGILRDPNAGTSALTGDDWWQAEAAAEVSPETDSVLVNGVRVAGGSLVRLRPSRRADAQDLFFADKLARVSAVHVDLDGQTHVAVTLLDDPAAELHDWYGRYLHFAPEELEPITDTQHPREESSP